MNRLEKEAEGADNAEGIPDQAASVIGPETREGTEITIATSNSQDRNQVIQLKGTTGKRIVRGILGGLFKGR